MDKTCIPILAEVIDSYYSEEEIGELAAIFDVNLLITQRQGLAVARRLIEGLDQGNHRVMLEAVLEQVDLRSRKGMDNDDGERRAFHVMLFERISDLRNRLGESAIPRELAVPEDKPFAAKSEVREFLEKANTPILIVDPYVGVGTLDCFRSVKVPVRLLTGKHANSIEQRFDAALQAFLAEDFELDVRQHRKLHDRHIVFNERCWLVGSSLKDAGKKAFHAIEIIDAKAEVTNTFEAKWQAGTPYP